MALEGIITKLVRISYSREKIKSTHSWLWFSRNDFFSGNFFVGSRFNLLLSSTFNSLPPPCYP